TYALFPYTTLFRSAAGEGDAEGLADRHDHANVEPACGRPARIVEGRVGDGDAGVGDLERGGDGVGAGGTQACADEGPRRAGGAEVVAIAHLGRQRLVGTKGPEHRQFGIQGRHVGAADLHAALARARLPHLADQLALLVEGVGELDPIGIGQVVNAVVAARADAQLGIHAGERGIERTQVGYRGDGTVVDVAT